MSRQFYAPTFVTLRGSVTLPGSAVAGLLVVVGSVVCPVAAAGQAGAAQGGTVQEPPLEEGRPVRGSLEPGDTLTWSMEMGDGYFVLGTLTQESVDARVRVIGPDGTTLATFDDFARGPERFFADVDTAGQYGVQVTTVGDESGQFELVLDRLEPLESDPKKLTDQLLSPWDTDNRPGAAVAVWRDGRILYSRGYGMANLAYDIPFEEDTRTNIGSTSKQFTAFAIMLQAEAGALSLDDDIRTYVPELPEFDETITVRHLITHTSGLREVFNLLLMTGRRIDHGDFVDRSEVLDVAMRQPSLQNVPGSEWNYNNTAFSLAALIVERTSGQTFPDYMAEHVFGPLGMTRTSVRPHAEAVMPERSQGYQAAKGGFREIRDLGAAVGAGGIYSTVLDLQRWAQNYEEPRVGTPAMVEEMSTSYVLASGDSTGYGYGLFVDEQGGLRRVHHGGADIAHRSMLAMYPEIGAGITTQSNDAAFDSNIAFRLAEAFFADAMDLDDAASEGGVDGALVASGFDPARFDEYMGRYALDAAPTFILTFTREDSTFYTQATGQQPVEMSPTSDSTFALIGVEATVVFHRDAGGDVEGLTLNQNGRQHATRLEGEAEEEWAPSDEERLQFAGRYYSDEIETFFDVVVEDGALVARQRRLDPATLTAEDEDTFRGSDLTLTFELTFTFERDRNGRVIGFYLSNGRTRDVRFDRVR